MHSQQAQMGVRLCELGLRSVEAVFVGSLESNKWVSQQITLAQCKPLLGWCERKRSAALDQVTLAKLVTSSSLIDQRRLVAIQRKHANAFLMACPRRFLGCDFNDFQFRVTLQRWLGQTRADNVVVCKALSPRATRCLEKETLHGDTIVCEIF